MVHPLWRITWRFLEKLKIKLLYDPEITLQKIYPEKTITQKDTCTPVFTAPLFTVARTCKQPRYPSRNESVKKIWENGIETCKISCMKMSCQSRFNARYSMLGASALG